MGKKNKKRASYHNNDHGHSKKRPRKQGGGYWINSCRESAPKEGGASIMTVLISQSDLTDNHAHVPEAQDKSKLKTSETTKNEQETKAESILSEAEKEEVSKCAADPVDKSSNEAKSSQEMKQQEDHSHAFISVKRLPSASGPQKVYEEQNFLPLPNGDCGDGIVNPHSKDQVADKYWAQRKRLFTRFEDGIQLDKEGWYSVTPEAIANHIADRVISSFNGNDNGLVILDAFCGCGGNAIAFARRPEVSLVVCVDTDLGRLQMAANNASIYNIEKEKLLFIHDNAIQILSRYSNGTLIATTKVDNDHHEESKLHDYTCNGTLPNQLDCIFLSPPWGGVEYEQIGKGHFSVKTHISVKDSEDSTVNGEELLSMTAKASQRCVYFLPRNLNGIAMGRSALQAGYTGSVELEKNVLNGKFKTIAVFLGFDSNDSTLKDKE